jgi:hypothetical protein
MSRSFNLCRLSPPCTFNPPSLTPPLLPCFSLATCTFPALQPHSSGLLIDTTAEGLFGPSLSSSDLLLLFEIPLSMHLSLSSTSTPIDDLPLHPRNLYVWDIMTPTAETIDYHASDKNFFEHPMHIVHSPLSLSLSHNLLHSNERCKECLVSLNSDSEFLGNVHGCACMVGISMLGA